MDNIMNDIPNPFPFNLLIDYKHDTTGIIRQIIVVKKMLRDLEEEVRKLDTLINPRNVEMDMEITDD